MRNINTLSKIEYVWNNIYWTALVFMFYRCVLFGPVLGLNYRKSTFVLAGVAVVCVAIGVLLTWKRRRNYISIVSNLMPGFGIYFVVSYWKVAHRLIIITGCVVAVAVFLYCLFVWLCYRQEKRNRMRKATIWQWCSFCLFNCRTLISFVLVFLLIGTVIRPPLVPPKADPDGNAVGSAIVTEDEETIAKNMQTVLLLQEESWCKLDGVARLEVMQVIADIEANYLGIEKLSVRAEVLEEKTMGYYNDKERVVTLDQTHLANSDASDVLRTLCHECYHAYQYRMVDLYDKMSEEERKLYLFRDAARYKDEFANYVDGLEDPETYSMQLCEMNSRAYANEAVRDYFYRINQYNEENGIKKAS